MICADLQGHKGDQVLVEDLAAYLAGRQRCDAGVRRKELQPIYQDRVARLD